MDNILYKNKKFSLYEYDVGETKMEVRGIVTEISPCGIYEHALTLELFIITLHLLQ